jgi:sugar/nucleoside kinase (ribokinase family)
MTLDQFATQVRQRGAPRVIITDAAEPIHVYDDDGTKGVLKPPQVDVVDSTGAGDAFRAGVVYGILQGLSLEESAALGAAAGSINVGREGAASQPPNYQEVIWAARQLALRSG